MASLGPPSPLIRAFRVHLVPTMHVYETNDRVEICFAGSKEVSGAVCIVLTL